MLLDRPGIISLNHGARENLNRPAIDPLFRSAAHTYGPRITGVILTGTMDDGAAGMLAVKLYGGQTVVQHPDDALYPELPRAMLEQVEGIDYVVPLSEMAALLVQLAHQHRLNESETRTQAMMLNSTPSDPLTIEPDVLICPECGGALTEVQLDRLVQYQCHTGHIFSLKTLQTAYSDEVEHALWAALRALKEKAILNRRLAQRTSIARLRVEYQSEAEAAWTQASILQELLAELGRLHYMESTE